MAPVEVKEISRADALAAMHAARLRAPVECDTPEDIAAYGECFELRTPGSAGVFVVRRYRGVLWVDGVAAHGQGGGLTAAGLALFDHLARAAGCTQVAFETNRRGLVRASKKHGYTVAGYIMKKEVPQ